MGDTAGLTDEAVERLAEVSGDRLEKLRQVRNSLDGGAGDARRLISACLPGWTVQESRSDCTGPHRLWLVDPDGVGRYVDEPLASERGAIWFIRTTLPGWSWALSELQEERQITCWLYKPQLPSPLPDREATVVEDGETAPLACCHAVVEALIFQLERQAAA